MTKTYKTKKEAIKRKEAFNRLMKMRDCIPGLPPPEIYGIKAKKTGLLTLDNLVESCE